MSQTKLDRVFEPLADVRRFAEPLLKRILKDRFGVELDVTRTYLRLYLPKGILPGYQVKTLSLLDAALNNFETKEAVENYFDDASCFISGPDNLGHFSNSPVNKQIKVSEYISMCRELDIGGQYSRELEAILLPRDAVAKNGLEYRVKTSQKDAFRAAVLMARMKGDIGTDSESSLLRLLEGASIPFLQCHQLQVMTAKLTGVMVLAGDLEHSSSVEPLVVYIPNDPQHPLKEYPSTLAFAAVLTEQLRAPAYQRFFARFIAHEQRGHFFAALDQQLNVVKWNPPQPDDPQPAWRRVPVENPRLRFHSHRIEGDPWQWLYQDALNKILNDARIIAVPTADEDRQSRWALWVSLEKVASIVVQVAALVAMPFVPFLGELMLAYTTYQLLDDAFTGILDWAEGQVSEAAGHLLSIGENLAQLAAFIGGATVAGKILAIKPSAFVEGLKPVVFDDGRTRLWYPDLQPYTHPVLLADDVPDELGLRHQAGKTFLPLEGRNYEVIAEPESAAYHVRHPQRPNAYRPRLNHNGAGAWAHEVERPMEWQGAQLFRRLGHSVAEFSDDTARRILSVSGIDEAMLRHMHVHAQRPPALLEDTIRRFKLDQRIELFNTQMASPDSAVYAKADVHLQLHLLKTQKVDLPEQRLRGGDVIATVLEVVPEREQKILMGLSSSSGDALPGRQVCADLLRNRMARWAQEYRASLFNSVEESFESAANSSTQQMRRIFPDLPRSVAQELWREATAGDRLHLLNNPGIPRRMASEALFYLRELRLNRACEGLYLHAVSTADSDMLALHMLETLEGWNPAVRLEVRDGDVDGVLLDSIGSVDAPIRKVLVKQAGRYETYDDKSQQLHGLDDLFGAVQHALPQPEREALGFPHVGQGHELEQAVIRLPLLPRAELRTLFGQPPLAADSHSPMRLAVGRAGYLLGGGDFKPVNTLTFEQRLRALFPALSEEDMAALRSERLSGEPLLAITRLENEYLTLVNELELWVQDVPSLHPITGLPLDAGIIAEQTLKRRAFMEELKASWSRKPTPASPYEPYHFYLYLDIIGELPELSADFSHVTELVLGSRLQPLRGDGFLKSFTGLQFLTLEGIELSSFPMDIYQMRGLVSLTLDRCALRLSEATAEGLSRIESLELLSLNDNPLGISPHLGYMKGLRDLYLRNTGITEVPSGLFDLERLSRADLTFNEIVDLPEEFFEVPDTRALDIDLSDNPLGFESIAGLKEYLAQASLDREISVRFDGAPEVEEALIDSEDESTDSAISSGAESDVER
ncbi:MULTISPECIES: dermonecrotic toxin domain-containing protein [unclassified Pseudomonas]|uniref:DUF6543 domain-containing protein n=1 Tax=Pseudomonas sp. MYb327 TaxID=2745230 RepID=A0AAU8DZJ6_9PSED